MNKTNHQSFTEFCNTPIDYAQMSNAEADYIYFTYLYQIALNMFKYENLPDTIDPFYMEWCLQNNGYCLFYRDELLGDIVTQCTLGGRINHQMQPTEYHTVDPSGVLNKEVGINEGVLIKNTPLYLPITPTLNFYAKQLSLCTRTIEENLTKQWTPYIITGDKRMLNSFKAFINQVKKGVSTIFVSKGFDPNAMGVLNTTAPYIADNINTTKQSIMRECMTVLGIDNANMDKKERVQTAEVEANNEQITASRNIMLIERQKAVEQINKKYGLNIEVYFATEEEIKDDLEDEEDFEIEEKEEKEEKGDE